MVISTTANSCEKVATSCPFVQLLMLLIMINTLLAMLPTSPNLRLVIINGIQKKVTGKKSVRILCSIDLSNRLCARAITITTNCAVQNRGDLIAEFVDSVKRPFIAVAIPTLFSLIGIDKL